MGRYIRASREDKLRKVAELAGEVEDFLYSEDISRVELWNYEIYEPIDRIAVISIYINGDWKHDHLRADWLVKERFTVIKIDCEELEDTGSDWGPELHTYYIYMDEA